MQKDIFDVLDELIGPLSSHILSLLSQPVTGTDDGINHMDTQKAYLGLLNNIMASNLQGIFVSERMCLSFMDPSGVDSGPGNKRSIEALLEAIQRIAEDVSDPGSQRVAFIFLGRCVSAWGKLEASSVTANDVERLHLQEGLPGFDRFIFERLLPTAFGVPWLPAFNLKDGQMLSVSMFPSSRF
jgi:exportin-T